MNILGFLPLFILSYLLVPIFWLVAWRIRKKNAQFFKNQFLPAFAHAAAIGLALTVLIWGFAYFFPLLKSVKELFLE